MLEVGTYSRVRDICQSVITRLQLASWGGCSLFIKIADKVQSAGWARGGGKGGHVSGVCGILPRVLGQAPHCTRAVRMKGGELMEQHDVGASESQL